MSDSLHAVEDVFVRAITYQAKGVLSFELRRVDGCDLPPFTAGAHIEVILPTGMVRSYSLVNSQHERHRYVIAVGRDPASTVCINDASVSRHHARITISGAAATLEDLKSKNGTQIMGATIQVPSALRDGDEIEFGHVKGWFIVEASEEPPTTTGLS